MGIDEADARRARTGREAWGGTFVPGIPSHLHFRGCGLMLAGLDLRRITQGRLAHA